MGDLFDFPSGAGLSKFRWDPIQKSYWGYDDQYNKGQTMCLIHVGRAVEPDGSVHEDYKELYPAASFEPADEAGERAIHEQDEGKDKTFQANSNVGKLFTSAMKAGLDARTRFAGDPRWAAPWVGTVADMEESVEAFTVTDKNSGEPKEVKSRRAMMSGFVGFTDEGAATGAVTGAATVETGAAVAPAPVAAAAPSNGATAAAAAPVAPPAAATGGGGLSPVEQLKLGAEAKELGEDQHLAWLQKYIAEGKDMDALEAVWVKAHAGVNA